MKKFNLLLVLTLGLISNSFAQCPTGLVNVTVDVQTDDWGYECYWDLTPTGNGCGNGTLFTFGNTAEVNCAGSGAQVATAGGYGDNTTTTEALGCLAIGSCFDINYIDDYADGGANFIVKFNGIVMHTFISDFSTGSATYTFCVSTPPVYDAGIATTGSKYTMLPLSQSLNFVTPATIKSEGTGTITGAKANVKVFKSGVQVHNVTSAPQTLTTLATGNYTLSPYTPQSYGEHEVKYTSQINEVDEVAANDSISFVVNITDTVYAMDNDTSITLIGLASGELGYLGNLYEIDNATKASSVSIYLGDGTQTSGASAVDSIFIVRIFNTDAMGIPTTILASTTGVIENVLEKWYTVSFANPVNLIPGKYMVAIEEENYVQEVGVSNVFNPASSYVYSLTLAPWSPVENFGLPATFMIRLNLESAGLDVADITNPKLDIYPNPVRNNLTIANTDKNTKIEIYNQLGQLIHSSQSTDGNTIIDVNSLSNGFYTIRTIGNNVTGLAKFIKE